MKLDNISVLLVDDDPTFVGMAEDMLTEADSGFDVDTMTDPRAALEAVLDDPSEYDCVVCDYKMPGMDGLEFYQKLLDEDYDKPYYVLTNKGDEQVANAALELGVADYITKQNRPEKYAAMANRIRNSVKYHYQLAESSDLDSVSARVVEDSPDGVLIHDGDEILHVNDNLAHAANANRRLQLIGRQPDDIIASDDHPLEWEHTSEYEWNNGELTTVDGETKPVKLAGTVVPYDGNEDAYRFVIRVEE